MYRDCINSYNRGAIGVKGTGDCKAYNYPPGMTKACVCTGDLCNRENGVMDINGQQIATINGRTPADAAAAEAAVIVMPPSGTRTQSTNDL